MLSILLAPLCVVLAAPINTPTGFIAIHSGSSIQYQSIKLSSDGHLSLNGETDATFTLNDDTSMFVNGKGLDLFEGFPVVKDDGTYGAAWGIENGHLTFAGSDSFTVCQGNNKNIAFSGHGIPSNCDNPIGVVFRSVPQ